MSGNLAHSPARIVANLLADLGVGTLASSGTGDWRITYSMVIDVPDDVITIYDTTGIKQGRAHTSGEVFMHYGIQIAIRSADYDTGYVKAKSIATILDETVKYAGVTIDSSVYSIPAISRRGSIISLGQQDSVSERNVFTINALVALRQTV